MRVLTPTSTFQAKLVKGDAGRYMVTWLYKIDLWCLIFREIIFSDKMGCWQIKIRKLFIHYRGISWWNVKISAKLNRNWNIKNFFRSILFFLNEFSTRFRSHNSHLPKINTSFDFCLKPFFLRANSVVKGWEK